MIFLPLLFGVGLIVAAFLVWRGDAFASIPPIGGSMGGEPGQLHLSGTFLPQDEVDTIERIANGVGIDARLLAAIRKAENGGPGREFGVLSVYAPTYDAQARAAAQTIRNNVSRYESEFGYSATVGDRYTDEFIAYLGSRYAPVGASNDPGNLNVNWVNNVSLYYRGIIYA